jgi:hypothetical protein
MRELLRELPRRLALQMSLGQLRRVLVLLLMLMRAC